MVGISQGQLVVVTQGPRKAALVTNRSIPRLRDDYILVRTVTGRQAYWAIVLLLNYHSAFIPFSKKHSLKTWHSGP